MKHMEPPSTVLVNKKTEYLISHLQGTELITCSLQLTGSVISKKKLLCLLITLFLFLAEQFIVEVCPSIFYSSCELLEASDEYVILNVLFVCLLTLC